MVKKSKNLKLEKIVTCNFVDEKKPQLMSYDDAIQRFENIVPKRDGGRYNFSWVAQTDVDGMSSGYMSGLSAREVVKRLESLRSWRDYVTIEEVYLKSSERA